MLTGLGTLTVAGLFGGALFGADGLEPIEAVEVQQTWPTKQDRQIDLTSATWYFAKTSIADRLELRLGVTASRAFGSILQTQGRIEEGTFRSERLDSPAWGIGPTVNGRLRLAEGLGARLTLDASGSVMLYDRAFPSGGSWYNGMVQAGPSLSWSLKNKRNVTLGARWLHISNGQGLGAHNPSYDGRGVFVQYERALGRGGRASS